MNGTVIIGYPPVVDAGADETVCLLPSTTLSLTGNALNYNPDTTLIQWVDLTSSGTFSNPHSLATNYMPNSTSGIRRLQLTVQGINGCKDVMVSDEKEVEFLIPTVIAGTNDTICGLNPYVLSQAKADYAVNYAWTTSGTGTFTDQYQLKATYFPSPADMNSGHVVLTLTITDECGNVVTGSMTLTLGQLPAAFYSFKKPICNNAPVYFTDQSSVSNGIIKKWLWDFGDGTQDTIFFPNNPDVQHIFAAPGSSFLVKLSVYTSLSCSSEFQQVITILKAPVANYFHSNIS